MSMLTKLFIFCFIYFWKSLAFDSVRGSYLNFFFYILFHFYLYPPTTIQENWGTFISQCWNLHFLIEMMAAVLSVVFAAVFLRVGFSSDFLPRVVLDFRHGPWFRCLSYCLLWSSKLLCSGVPLSSQLSVEISVNPSHCESVSMTRVSGIAPAAMRQNYPRAAVSWDQNFSDNEPQGPELLPSAGGGDPAQNWASHPREVRRDTWTPAESIATPRGRETLHNTTPLAYFHWLLSSFSNCKRQTCFLPAF